MLNTISIIELVNLNSPIIVDIRNYYFFEMGHIDGAICIPYYNLLNNYSHYLNKLDTYYLYWDNGNQSFNISNRLNSFGYDTYSINGGYEEYKRYMGRWNIIILSFLIIKCFLRYYK